MQEDKKLETINIICTRPSDLYFDSKSGWVSPPDKSRRYAYPQGYWTLEVFYNGETLIPEERVECAAEPNLDDHAQILDAIGGGRKFFQFRNPTWRPVTVTYQAYGDNVGAMLIDQHQELEMVHHATAELTYWLGVDKPDRTWTLKDWMVVNLQTTPTKTAIFGLDLTFLFSEASLTRH